MVEILLGLILFVLVFGASALIWTIQLVIGAVLVIVPVGFVLASVAELGGIGTLVQIPLILGGVAGVCFLIAKAQDANWEKKKRERARRFG